MWEDEDSDEFERFQRTVDKLFAETLAGVGETLFDIGGKALKPLYRVEVSDEDVTVVFDLPRVKKQDLILNSTEEVLSIEAKLRKPVTLRVGTVHRSHSSFEKYSKKIALPVRVDPAKATARFSNGILLVKLPRARGGKTVKIA